MDSGPGQPPRTPDGADAPGAPDDLSPRPHSDEAANAAAIEAMIADFSRELELGPIAVQRAPRPDPWAHRRGEPRVFAFLWTVYVLVCVAGSVLWLARSSSVTASTYGPAARIMLMVVSAGAIVLWPMLRLSQTAPRGSPLRAAAADVLVVLFPMQMVVWPLIMLAQWPLGIVAAISALTAAWVVLVGGVQALAFAVERRRANGPGNWSRALWMLLCLALAGAAPLAALMRRAIEGPQASVPDWWSILSPFTAIGAVTGHGFSGPQAPVNEQQWWAIAGIGGAALALWALAAAWPRPAPSARAESPNLEVGVAPGEDRA